MTPILHSAGWGMSWFAARVRLESQQMIHLNLNGSWALQVYPSGWYLDAFVTLSTTPLYRPNQWIRGKLGQRAFWCNHWGSQSFTALAPVYVSRPVTKACKTARSLVRAPAPGGNWCSEVCSGGKSPKPSAPKSPPGISWDLVLNLLLATWL